MQKEEISIGTQASKSNLLLVVSAASERAAWLVMLVLTCINRKESKSLCMLRQRAEVVQIFVIDL